MNYQATIDFLFSQFPVYQKDGGSAYKPGLERIFELSALAANPHEKIKTIHLAGTNGKGSTSHMLASILQEAGYKVGLFTSPHLIDFRERIKINGEVIPEQNVIDFVETFKSVAKDIQPSFFEYTTVMAFDYFSKEQVDIAIIETGLGGRLDCSNIITPEVSVITNIGLDHVQFLGTTLGEIAKEKAGIIKPNVPVVVGRKQGETVTVFDYFAHQNQTKITWSENISEEFECDLKGDYQKENIQTAVATIQTLNSNWEVSKLAIQEGLKSVVKNTQLRGRWEELQSDPRVICDTGHNEDGVRFNVNQLANLNYSQLHIVWGMVDDKDVEVILKMLPNEAQYYWCKAKIGRALKPEELQSIGETLGLKGGVYASVEAAMKSALSHASQEDLVFIGGSTFVVADALS